MVCVDGKTRGFLVLALLCCLTVPVSAGSFKVQELDISREDEGTGKSIFTVHILPGETKKFDKVEYILIYHQDFPFEDSRGNKYHKIHEPAKYKYTRRKVKFVEDLDSYVNFRVPVSRDRLRMIYGKFAFHPKYPITIPRMIIRAYDDGDVVWEQVVRTDKSYVWDDKKEALVIKPDKRKAAPSGK
jgi:hypothetical protein